jgi:NhaP-type Na+/H+ or K+/H+ antiporter
MDVGALSLVLAAIFVWGVISARATAISTPIFFVAIGLLLAEGLKLVHLGADPHATRVIAEVTLVWVLFADACRVRLSNLRDDLSYYVRLLAIGLPLTIALGAAAAAILLGGQPLVRAACGGRLGADRRCPWLSSHVGSAGALSNSPDAQRGKRIE